MATGKKKATPAQLAARKRFAEMARSGAFKRRAGARKKVATKRRATKAPSPAQLAARAKFVAMVRAKAKGKKANPLFGFGRVKKRGRKKVKKGLFGLAKKTRRVSYQGSKGSGFLGVTARTQWGLKRKKRRAQKKLKSLFNPAQRAALRKVAQRYNPGKIRFTEAELARYAPKIKGLSLVSTAPATKKKRKTARFKKPAKRALARAFSGSGLLRLGRSRKTVRVNRGKAVKKYAKEYGHTGKKASRIFRAMKRGHVAARQGAYRFGFEPRARKAERKAKKSQGALRRLLNPSPASVFSEFRGKDVRSKSRSLGHGSGHLTVAQLGKLHELGLNGRTLRFGGKALLCADGRKKIHIGGVRMKAQGGEVDMGEVLSVSYISNKPHIETGTFNYKHHFGEDGGKRPRLIVDAEGYPFFEGGSYKIDADGIIN